MSFPEIFRRAAELLKDGGVSWDYGRAGNLAKCEARAISTAVEHMTQNGEFDARVVALLVEGFPLQGMRPELVLRHAAIERYALTVMARQNLTCSTYEATAEGDRQTGCENIAATNLETVALYLERSGG